MAARCNPSGPVKRTADVLASLFTTQPGLGSGVSTASQAGCQQWDAHYLANVVAQFKCLIEASPGHSQRMQRYRDQRIRKCDVLIDDGFAQEVTQNPSGGQLTIEFEYLHQVIGGIQVLQWADGAGKQRWVLYAAATA